MAVSNKAPAINIEGIEGIEPRRYAELIIETEERSNYSKLQVSHRYTCKATQTIQCTVLLQQLDSRNEAKSNRQALSHARGIFAYILVITIALL